MVQYNFKEITPVPSAKEFIDIMLSKTQRKTPTVVHKGYAITRIRSFYLRKIKYTATNFAERLNQILSEFPRIDNLHPFYSDLCSVLYDRDHYRLSLGRLATAKHLIEAVAKDYVRLLKYGDSLYRCKNLKRAALGRMATIMRKQAPALSYLEEVRQHLGRLPSIDPNARTLLVCGYPNVGKSSFLNKVTRAEVEVQPYAFTTKSLYVGHCDYKYLRWQVIDSPGILDHPLEERNTIEMQSITAMAHLRAAILFFIDISEQCGYSVDEQVSLFKSIRPLFANKPLQVVLNKVDVVTPEELDPAVRETLSLFESEGIPVKTMSTLRETGVSKVKESACEALLEHRVEAKLKSKHAEQIVGKLFVAEPTPRDDKERPSHIPEAVLERRRQAAAKKALLEKKRRGRAMDSDDEDGADGDDDDDMDMGGGGSGPGGRKLERDLEVEGGGAGVYNVDMRKHYDLANPDWVYDVVPEIMDGKNIADFIDPDIWSKLEALEAEEAKLAEEWEAAEATGGDDAYEIGPAERELLDKINKARRTRMLENRLKNRGRQGMSKSMLPKRIGEFKESIERLGIDGEQTEAARKARGRSRTAKERRTPSQQREVDAQSRSRSRSRSLVTRPESVGLRDPTQVAAARKAHKRSQRRLNEYAKKGEGDRVVVDLKPKHLFSGKRGLGTNDRR